MTRSLFIALLAPALMTACQSQPMQTIDPTLGQSVRHNMAAHIIDLPAPLSDVAPGIPGPRSGLAIDRYMRGEVIQPITDDGDIEITSGGKL